ETSVAWRHAVGGRLATVGIPVITGALGFTSAGIAAGSVATSMMSATAIANGGAVASGSVVSILQSIGAVGLSAAAKTAMAAGGALVGAMVSQPKD
uniref:Uncharacterized protein n=1 Tax=Varanus komodoensis TaxID=61221 RepID=A0A8D2L967_VARKO